MVLRFLANVAAAAAASGPDGEWKRRTQSGFAVDFHRFEKRLLFLEFLQFRACECGGSAVCTTRAISYWVWMLGCF